MGLVFPENIKKQIADELSSTSEHLHIISAYCKLDAVRFIEDCIKENIPNKKLMVRFKFDDIISGASDLKVYEYCKQFGWQVYVRFDLHAKTYVFDRNRGIIGSANLTSKGVGLGNQPNCELAYLAPITNEEMMKINSLFESALLMTDDLYEKMRICLEATNANHCDIGDWSDDILRQFSPEVDVLFVHEFPNCPSLSSLREDSLDFLGLAPGWDIADIKEAFLKSNAYIWLRNLLHTMPDQEIYFGALSSALHDAIVNDPKPYRKEIKVLQCNLLSWITELDIHEILIDRPNHSQRIRLMHEDAAFAIR